MSKDPAFLFYPGDWLGGTMTFNRHQKGAYMDLLMAQFNQVALTIEDIRYILGADFEVIWEVKLRSKFEVESEGKLFFNRKLREEMLKRRMFCASRSNNKQGKNQHFKEGHKTKHMLGHTTSHMENKSALHSSTPNFFGDQETDGMLSVVSTRAVVFNFEDIYSRYPSKIGKKAAMKHFKVTVKNEQDMDNINQALNNYLKSERVQKGIIQNASTWFNNWQDWIDYADPVAPIDEEKETLRKAGMINESGNNGRNERNYNQR